jgi:hypothetical protein
MRRQNMTVLFAFLTCVSVAHAQQEVRQTIQISGDQVPLPMMGGQRQFKTGTGRIRGRVLSSDGSAPLRRAQVRISGTEVAPKAALTDADGRYEFRELPAGRFTLTATKSGHVSVQYGQTRPFESGRPIELADKQALDNADIAMPRGSVITGRIVDEFGEPLADVTVNAMRQSWSNGRRRLMPAPGRTGQTNDLGQFRIFGLPPGDYYVSATLRGAGLEMMAMEMEVMMVGPASGAGPTASMPKSGYAPTYFPGTPNASDAQRITLPAGQESPSVDFGLVPVKLSRITGIVMGSDGKPLEGSMLNLTPASRNELTLPLGLGSARSGKDGSFTINNVAPGDYLLQARGMQIMMTSAPGGGDATMVFRTASMAGGGESEFGSQPLSVGGEEVANVILMTSKGTTATGRVTFEGGDKPASLNSIRIMSLATDADGPIALGGGGGASPLKEDGTFELKGLAGMRLIRLAGAPQGWIVKSVRLNGQDITDTGTEFKPGEAVSGLEVVLTSRTTSVSGGVTAGDGDAIKDYTVVVFSDSPEHWRLPMTRYVQGTRPNQEGRFQIQNLPPGSYYAIAVDYVPQGEWGDPELLERLRAKARRFSVDEGQTQTLDLKLVADY